MFCFRHPLASIGKTTSEDTLDIYFCFFKADFKSKKRKCISFEKQMLSKVSLRGLYSSEEQVWRKVYFLWKRNLSKDGVSAPKKKQKTLKIKIHSSCVRFRILET